MVKEQLLNCLPEEVRVWIRERKPKNNDEAGELAKDFLQARDTRESEGRNKTTKEHRPPPPGDCPRCGLVGHWVSDCPKPQERVRGGNPSNGEKPKKLEREVTCFSCKKKGHMSFKCPKTAGLYCDEGNKQESKPEQQSRKHGCLLQWQC